MALGAIPDEINRHIQAVLVLSKRDVLLRILREGDHCLQPGHLAAATVLAGVALEEASLLVGSDALEERKHQLEVWREMRNRAAHSSPGSAQLDEEDVKSDANRSHDAPPTN